MTAIDYWQAFLAFSALYALICGAWCIQGLSFGLACALFSRKRKYPRTLNLCAHTNLIGIDQAL